MQINRYGNTQMRNYINLSINAQIKKWMTVTITITITINKCFYLILAVAKNFLVCFLNFLFSLS